tara:strand:+ start:226 stop:528 length:303 start_codon:yes stop_codon:yes gene_type:complete
VVEAMSRRRSSDPADKITISLPRSLNNRLSNHLGYEISRSAWIAGAIRDKLNHDSSAVKLSEATLEQLVVMSLRNCDKHTAEYQMLLTVYDFVRKPETSI